MSTREAFEQFMSHSRRNKGVKKAAQLLNKFEDGTYINEHVQRHWWTWQQAAALSTPLASHAGAEPAKVRMWHDRIKDAHPGSTPEYWPSSLKAEYMEAEILELRATLSNPAPVAAPASVAQAIDQLVSTLAESKGWMRDYARALIEDAIDRRHLEVAAPAPASEAVAWEAASERYLADIIDRAPEPLRRLGEWLSLKLDEDDWKTAERYVLGAMESIATPSTGGGK